MTLMLKLLLLGFLSFYLPALAAAQTPTKQCNTSELSPDANAATAQAYLKQDRQNLTSACIESAIGIICHEMYAMYTPAISVLIKYLDFKAYPTPRVCYDPFTRPTCGFYPAVDALARFQDSAIPALKGAVQDEDLSKTARLNAALALFHVVKNRPEQIRFTIKTAQSSRYPEIADALTKLAKKWAKYCIPAERQQCSDALNMQ
jgi:hypothetical protein